MKVNTIDIIWAVASMIILAVSFKMGHLIYGLLIIYAVMDVIFFWHIFRIRAYMEKSIAVYGTIIKYYKEKNSKGFCPVVQYTTEDEMDVMAIYTVVSRKQKYEIGSEVTVCYNPENPMSFYFMGHEEELTATYYRFIIIGGIISVILLILSAIL